MREALTSVRVRLVAATVVAVALALAISATLLVRSVQDTQQARLRAEIERRLDTVARGLEAGHDLDAAVRAAGPVGIVQLRDASTGDVLSVNGTFVAGAQPAAVPFDAPLPAPGQQVEASVEEAPGIGVRLETISRTVETAGGAITIVAAAPADEVARSVEAVRRALLLGLPGLLALVAVVAWAIVDRSLRPVEAMRREVEAITASTLHRRVPQPATPDEIGRLARTMNSMLDRLEHAATRQREFVSDASHELRSPVATIRTELEVALRAGDVESLRRSVTSALAEEARLEALLADLLLLATVGDVDVPREPVAVHDVVREEARRPRHVEVDVVEPLDDALVQGRRSQLERVVANLLDNATRHARSHVRVSLRSDPARGDLVLAVDDDGPGIPDSEQERVFERFTRLDEGRGRDEGGVGLGLAIVRGIVSSHGGTIVVGRSALTPPGARFEVRLPVAAAAPGTVPPEVPPDPAARPSP